VNSSINAVTSATGAPAMSRTDTAVRVISASPDRVFVSRVGGAAKTARSGADAQREESRQGLLRVTSCCAWTFIHMIQIGRYVPTR
jgi:hypothetical protein